MHRSKTIIAAERRTANHHRPAGPAVAARPAFPISPTELRRIVAELLG